MTGQAIRYLLRTHISSYNANKDKIRKDGLTEKEHEE
jgi:hypothetical protein